MIEIYPWALFALLAASFVLGGSLRRLYELVRERRRYGRWRF